MSHSVLLRAFVLAVLAIAGGAYWFSARERAMEPVPTRSPASAVVAGELADKPPLPIVREPEHEERAYDGRVFLPPGTPPDERVVVHTRSRPHLAGLGGGEVLEEQLVPDADGRFRFRVAQGARRARVWIEARYCRPDRSLLVDLDAAPASIEVRPTLGARISGVVVTPEGEPGALDGVRVRCMGPGSIGESDLPLDGGRFELNALPADEEHWFLVKSPRHPELRLEKRIVLQAGESRAVELRLKTGVVVAGRVTDFAGAPLADVRLEVSSKAPGETWLSSSQTDSNEDGRFVLPPVPAGRIHLSVSARQHIGEERELGAWGDGARVDDVVFRLPVGESITGRVRWPDDREPWQCVVRAYADVEPIPEDGFYGEELGWSLAAPDGSFELPSLEQGTYLLSADEVRVTQTWHESASAVVGGVRTGARDVELILSGGSPVRGRVVDAAGQPMPRFQVVATATSGVEDEVLRGFIDKKGRFTFSGLMDGEWTLVARAPGHTAHAPVNVVLPEGSHNLELVLQRDARITGIVRTPAGEPLPRAHVELRPIDDGPDAGTKPRHDRTDRAGKFSFRAVAPGHVQLSASASGHETGPALEFELTPGERRGGSTLRVGASR